MSTRSRITTLALALPLTLVVAACSTTGGTVASPDAGDPSSAPSAGGGGRGYDYGGGGAVNPSATAVEVGTGSSSIGTYLTGAGGLTLYIFMKDSVGASACDGECATNWPPLVVSDGSTVTGADGVTGDLTTFARADGSKQVAYDGKPLYYFVVDKAAGDTNGQGANDVWFIAEP